MDIDRIRQAAAEMVRIVEQSYQAQAGGASFCQLQKDGRVTGGVKYDEGRLVALHSVQRILKTCAGEGCLKALAAEQAIWLEALTAQQSRQPPAVAWLAYRQGGVDIFNWVVSQVQVDMQP